MSNWFHAFNALFINMIMLGAIVDRAGIPSIHTIMEALAEMLKNKPPKTLELNRRGMDQGLAYALQSFQPHHE
jgi:Pyruvate/2-oxoacid:ferredoxin oxidoreductase gamma subunit